MSRHFRSVHASPAESVVGQTVRVVPADLGGHKIRHAAFLHNLGQSSRIAEHVRQPQIFALIVKFFPEEIFSHQNLADDGFAGSDVAVALYPHRTCGFPFAFLYTLFDMLVHIGVILFEKIIKLGLGLQKQVFRIFLHQTVYCGEGAGCFFSGMA